MAARGQESKNIVGNKILEVFPDAFLEGKIIRIPFIEDGSEVQIKVTLTAAKDNLPHGAEAPSGDLEPSDNGVTASTEAQLTEPSAEELENVRRLMEKFSL